MPSAPSKQSTLSEKEALSVTHLRDVSDAQLVPLLFTAAHTLRAASTASESVSADYVHTLLTSRFLKSESADVRQLVGSILCDAVRLGCQPQPRSKASAAPTPSLPFAASKCDDVLRCLVFPFAEVVRTRAPLRQCALLIEAASASHILAVLLPHCHQDDVAAQLQSLFDAIPCANGDYTSRTNASASASARDGSATALSSATVSEMVKLLADVLAATGHLTTGQVKPLVHELTQTSPGLRRAELLTGLDNTKAKAVSAVTSMLSTTSPSAAIASRLLVEHAECLASALSTYAMDLVEEGVQELVAADITSSTNASTTTASSPERRSGFRHLSSGVGVLVAMGEREPALVSDLVPALLPLLQHDCADVRLVVLRGFSGALMASEAFFNGYRHLIMVPLLLCLQDTKPNIRLEIIQAVSAWVDAAVRSSWSHSTLESLWQPLAPVLERSLTDPSVLVRRQAVMCVAHCALVVPSVAALGAAAASADTPALVPPLARSLSLRTADKNATVRKSAVACLCELYREQLLCWIPDAVLNTVHAESGLFLIECELEQLLPPPTKANTSPRGSELLTATASTTASAHEASMAVFDFEKEALREERGFVDAFVQLCADVSPRHFTTLVSLMKKKPQLRTAIARLFELRETIKLKEDPKSPEGQTIIHSIHRLLDFLQSVTHAEKGEWDVLFRSKDDRVSKAFLHLCADDAQAHIVDWYEARRQLLSNLQGRLDTPAATFVRATLVPMLAFPVQLAHVEELIRQLETALAPFTLPSQGTRPSASVPPLSPHLELRVLGMLRALYLLILTAPSFLAHASRPLLALLTRMTEVLKRASRGYPNNDINTTGEWCALILSCVREWATYTASAGDLADYAPSRAASNRAFASGAPNSDSTNNQASSSSSGGTAISGHGAGTSRRHPLMGVTDDMKRAALDTLVGLCTGAKLEGLALAAIAHAATTSAASTQKKRRAAPPGAAADPHAESVSAAVHIHSSLVLSARLSKEAARCFGGLLAIHGFGSASDLRALLDSLCAQIHTLAREKAEPTTTTVADVRGVCCLTSLRAFLQDKTYAALVATDTLEAAISAVLLSAIRPCGGQAHREPARGTQEKADNVIDVLKVKAFLSASKTVSTTAGTGAPFALPRTPHGLLFSGPTIVVDKAAKALTALVHAQPADRRPAAAGRVLDVLLQGYKRSCEGAPQDGGDPTTGAPATFAQLSVVGACQVRLAIDKQLCRLLLTPSSDIGKEMAVAVLLSAEGEACVREPVQRKLVSLITRAGNAVDMRYVALFFLTAMSEESRQGFQQLRTLVQTIGDHLRQRQAASGASLSSPQALFCYLEYTLPFLVLFQAHHTYYTSECSTHFTAYQRVWHLLFDELFRYGTQCVSFLTELLGRIKQSEDVLDRTSERHRVLCDVASRVMQACLSQRQTTVEAVKRYPGVVLLPTFFSKSAKRDSQTVLSTVYLDKDVHIFANAPFRAPTTATTSARLAMGDRPPSLDASGAENGEFPLVESQSVTTSPPPSPSASRQCSGDRPHLGRRGAVTGTNAYQPFRHREGAALDEETAMASEEREMTPYDPLAATPTSTSVSTSHKRRSRSPSHDVLPSLADTSAHDKRARTEPPQPASDTDRTAVAQTLVTRTIDEVVRGLHKADIAAMRWKTVRARVEKALDRVVGASDDTLRAAMMAYAKEVLKRCYSDAPA